MPLEKFRRYTKQISLRNLIFTTHKFLGFNAALFFGMNFLTGALLLFEIDSYFQSGTRVAMHSTETRASFGEIFDSMSAALPGGRVFNITKEPRTGLADLGHVIDGKGKQLLAWSDPNDAAFIRTTNSENFNSYVGSIHTHMMIPGRFGLPLVSSMSIILIVILMSGLITYRKFWKGLYRLPNRELTQRTYWGTLHRLFAVWLIPFLLLSAVTTALIFITSVGVSGTVESARAPQERSEDRPQGFDGRLIDEVEQMILERYPAFEASIFSAPGNKFESMVFRGHMNGQKFFGVTTISVDPVSLEILGAIGPEQRGGISWLMPMIYSLHFGDFWGNYSRTIWLVFALSSAFLAFGGARVYLARTETESTGGTAKRFWLGLGYFRWLYLLAVLGMIVVSFR